MDRRPDDIDPTRATIAARELVATASGYLTSDVAMALPYDCLLYTSDAADDRYKV